MQGESFQRVTHVFPTRELGVSGPQPAPPSTVRAGGRPARGRYHLVIVDAAHQAPDGPVSALRGAGVVADARTIGRVLIGLLVLALAGSSLALLVAGVHRNDRIGTLRRDGVPVELTVSGCFGLLGGSGSNDAGYRCRVTYRLDGRTHQEALPGNVLYATGTVIRGIAVPGDPGLVSTTSLLAGERPSDGVYLLPAALLVVLGALAGLLLYRSRRSHRPERGRPPLGREREVGGV